MARYQTRRYVSISWIDATRLARIDGTPLDDVLEFPDARLLHRTEWWAYWSDGQLTTAIGLPEAWELQSLSVIAESLIAQVWMSKSRSPHCGWATLADIQDVISCTLEQISLQQPYYPITIESWWLSFATGNRERYISGFSDIRMDIPVK
ncbi:MAG: hypothetical protein AAGD25_33160 [Cyanobacteria bacterium P01_F01_bin.150]